MRIYKRGQVYWCEFRLDNKHYQYSCKTKDKEIAKEVASAIHADMIRNRFNIPAKNTVKRCNIFKDILYDEYINSCNIANSTLKPMLSRIKHFNIFFEKEINAISELEIKNFQIVRKLEIMSLPKNKNKREQKNSIKRRTC